MKKLIAVLFASILISCSGKNDKAKTIQEDEGINSIEEVQKEQSEQTVAEKQEASRLDSLRQVEEHGHAH